ncbi:unnamed protein product [Paramecium primaurelia]|uniref:Uncharacterized protein n=1 Tax=Paramecium primaurelia TaxID=5886 RepID=A0A8S1PSZ4_PARPR|nr:unnamed protein product [Paramecium primaurelia]
MKKQSTSTIVDENLIIIKCKLIKIPQLIFFFSNKKEQFHIQHIKEKREDKFNTKRIIQQLNEHLNKCNPIPKYEISIENNYQDKHITELMNECIDIYRNSLQYDFNKMLNNLIKLRKLQNLDYEWQTCFLCLFQNDFMEYILVLMNQQFDNASQLQIEATTILANIFDIMDEILDFTFPHIYQYLIYQVIQQLTIQEDFQFQRMLIQLIHMCMLQKMHFMINKQWFKNSNSIMDLIIIIESQDNNLVVKYFNSKQRISKQKIVTSQQIRQLLSYNGNLCYIFVIQLVQMQINNIIDQLCNLKESFADSLTKIPYVLRNYILNIIVSKLQTEQIQIIVLQNRKSLSQIKL